MTGPGHPAGGRNLVRLGGIMAEKKIIAVCGATGAQGGGLARAILADRGGGFTLRAITRKPDSERARALASGGEALPLPRRSRLLCPAAGGRGKRQDHPWVMGRGRLSRPVLGVGQIGPWETRTCRI